MIFNAFNCNKLITSRNIMIRWTDIFKFYASQEFGRHLHTKDELTTQKNAPLNGTNKVTVIGAGAVGTACALILLTQRITNSVCLIDTDGEKVKGEMLDLQHGSAHLKNANITAGSDYAIGSGSRVCIISAGVRFSGESRLNTVEANNELMKIIVPQIAKHSPNAILLMVINPVDIMTYAAWKLSGFPKHRVIGSGASLDTARFRFFLSQKIGISVSDCHGWVIGEHGNSSVPVWSGVNFGGVRLQELNPKASLQDDKENWAEIHKLVVKSAHEVKNRKGYTNWAVALCTSAITRSILTNNGEVHAVSVHAQGLHGIKENVFLSLPAVIGGDGIHDVIKLQLTDTEQSALQKSAQILAKAQAIISEKH